MSSALSDILKLPANERAELAKGFCSSARAALHVHLNRSEGGVTMLSPRRNSMIVFVVAAVISAAILAA